MSNPFGSSAPRNLASAAPPSTTPTTSRGPGSASSASPGTTAALKHNNAPKSTPLSSAGIAAAKARAARIAEADRLNVKKAEQAFANPSLAGLESISAAVQAKVALAETFKQQFESLRLSSKERAAGYEGDLLKFSMYKAYHDAAELSKQEAMAKSGSTPEWETFIAWLDSQIEFIQAKLHSASVDLAGDTALGTTGSDESLRQERFLEAMSAKQAEDARRLSEADAKGKRVIETIRATTDRLVIEQMRKAEVARAEATIARDAFETSTAALKAARAKSGENATKIKELEKANIALQSAAISAISEADGALLQAAITNKQALQRIGVLEKQLREGDAAFEEAKIQLAFSKQTGADLTRLMELAEVENDRTKAELTAKIKGLEATLNTTTAEKKSLIGTIVELQTNVATLNENVTAAAIKEAELQAQINYANARLSENSRQLEAMRSSLTDERIATLERDLTALRNQIDEKIEIGIAAAKAKQEAAEERAAGLETKLFATIANANAKQTKIAQLTEALGTALGSLSSAVDTIEDFKVQLAQVQLQASKDFIDAERIISGLQSQLATATSGSSNSARLSQELAATRQHLAEAQAREKAATEQLAKVPKRPIRLSGIFTPTPRRAQVLTPGTTLLKRSTTTRYKWTKCGTHRGRVWRCRGNAQKGGTRKKRSKKTRRRRH